MLKNFKFKFILTLFFFFFTIIKPSYPNNFEKVSACAGVVMADGALELNKKRNVKNFEVAFEIAIKAFYVEGLSQKKSSKDVANAEKIMMSSFENILGIRGFGEAAKLMVNAQEHSCTKVKSLRDYFQEKIKILSPETVIFGEKVNRVANTLLIALPKISGDLALMKLDLESFSVSSGSACSSGKISKSHVVSAMGYDKLASNSVRFSFPPNDAILKLESLITTKELDRLARCWSNL